MKGVLDSLPLGQGTINNASGLQYLDFLKISLTTRKMKEFHGSEARVVKSKSSFDEIKNDSRVT